MPDLLLLHRSHQLRLAAVSLLQLRHALLRTIKDKHDGFSQAAEYRDNAVLGFHHFSLETPFQQRSLHGGFLLCWEAFQIQRRRLPRMPSNDNNDRRDGDQRYNAGSDKLDHT